MMTEQPQAMRQLIYGAIIGCLLGVLAVIIVDVIVLYTHTAAQKTITTMTTAANHTSIAPERVSAQ